MILVACEDVYGGGDCEEVYLRSYVLSVFADVLFSN